MNAEELSKKRAQRLTNEAGINNHDKDLDVYSQGGLSTCPENCSIGVPSPLGGIGNAQELLEIVELPTWSVRAYRCDQDLYVMPMKKIYQIARLTYLFPFLLQYQRVLHLHSPLHSLLTSPGGTSARG